jgi:hypothetical protein
MATPSEQIASIKWNREQRNARIQALVEKARAFDAEHAAIVAEQQAADHVQPHVLRKMLAYSARMQVFEAELAALDAEEIKNIVASLGFPRA